jgi:hypothetical protein
MRRTRTAGKWFMSGDETLLTCDISGVPLFSEKSGLVRDARVVLDTLGTGPKAPSNVDSLEIGIPTPNEGTGVTLASGATFR